MSMSNLLKIYGWCWIHLIVHTSIPFRRILLAFLKKIIIELTHSKTILETTAEIEPQPAALDFKKLSQYSSRSK